MEASALLLTQNVQVQSVISSILAELSIETKLFTDVSLAQVALSGARFVAVVVDCDLAGAESLLNREGSPSNRAAVSFAVSTPGKSRESQKAGFALSKPLQRPLVRSTMRAASGLMLSLHRRTFRCELALPISVSNSERGFRADTTNVSMGGIAIQTREALDPDDEFKIEFALPNGFEVKADAMVVWTGKLGRAALRFTGMQNSAKDGLQDWIDTQIQKNQSGHKNKGTSSHEPALATPA
jgi:hypothetical protein